VDTLNLYVLGLFVTFVVRTDMHKMHSRIIWLISILRSIGSSNNKDAIVRLNNLSFSRNLAKIKSRIFSVNVNMQKMTE
jgi:hypothetical protein